MFGISQVFQRREKRDEQFAEMLRTGKFAKRRHSRSPRPKLTRMYRGMIIFAATVLVAVGVWGVIR